MPRVLADLLRSNLFPACYVTPPELEGLRRQMRFRRLIVEETVKFKNKTAGLLMEAGVEYQKRKLQGKQYFAELLRTDNAQIPPSKGKGHKNRATLAVARKLVAYRLAVDRAFFAAQAPVPVTATPATAAA
jgi:hypothetical protein